MIVVITMLVNKYGLGLLNPVISVKDKYLSSQQERIKLIKGVMGVGVEGGGGGFSNSDHLLALREERCCEQKNCDDSNDATLKGLVGDIIGTNQRLILRAKNTCVWVNVRGIKITGTLLSDK